MSHPKATKARTVKTLQVKFPADGDVNRQMAELVTGPSVQGAMSINQWSPVDNEVDLGSLVTELQKQAQLASSGDLSRSEAMLAVQAQTLDAIFNDLMRRAKAAEYWSQFEAYMRCGLKAQSQCRATLETLAAIKNPAPVAFVRQANIANGPQQVNNAPPPVTEPSRAREFENRPNELLEQQSNELLDSRAAQTAVVADTAMAALGEIDWTKDGRG